MAKSSMLEGYSYVPDSNYGKVQTPTGEIITRKQYRNIGARAEGYTSVDTKINRTREATAKELGISAKELKELRKTDEYKNLSKVWKDRNPGADTKRLSSEFTREFVNFIKSKDNSPTGPRADFLVKSGLRPKDAKWAVGETDKFQRGI